MLHSVLKSAVGSPPAQVVFRHLLSFLILWHSKTKILPHTIFNLLEQPQLYKLRRSVLPGHLQLFHFGSTTSSALGRRGQRMMGTQWLMTTVVSTPLHSALLQLWKPFLPQRSFSPSYVHNDVKTLVSPSFRKIYNMITPKIWISFSQWSVQFHFGPDFTWNSVPIAPAVWYWQ